MSSLTRRNHGSGHTYKLDGAWAPGVTTLNGKGFPKQDALVGWATRCSGNVVVDEWEHLQELTPSKRADYVRTAKDRDRDPLAKRGQQLHKLWERHASGEEVEVPDELEGHFRSYERFVEEWQPRELLLEAVIAKREPRYCGTLDVIADLIDGRRWLLDFKTSRSGVYPENALQLAAYRYADFYVDADGAEQPIPEVDATGVVWIRADGYDLVPVEAGPDEFLLFQMVMRIARFADRDLRDKLGGRDVVGSPLTPPARQEATA